MKFNVCMLKVESSNDVDKSDVVCDDRTDVIPGE